MTTTIDSITTWQIEALRKEAAMVGDEIQVAICDIALGNEPDLEGIRGLGPTGLTPDGSVVPVEALTKDQAIEACVDAINDAEAQG